MAVTQIASLCSADGVEISDSTIECAPNVLERIKFGVVGHNREPRTGFRIRIPSPNFSGNVQVLLGRGGGKMEIAGDGPIQLDVRLHHAATVRIGAGTTMNGVRIIADNADIEIGKDGLWSDEIIVQSNDQHGIVRRSTRELLNSHRRHVRVGDHVWVGRRAMLMPDVALGKGAIVGAGSIVTNDVAAFTAVAGVPARVIATDISWSRKASGLDGREDRFLD